MHDQADQRLALARAVRDGDGGVDVLLAGLLLVVSMARALRLRLIEEEVVLILRQYASHVYKRIGTVLAAFRTLPIEGSAEKERIAGWQAECCLQRAAKRVSIAIQTAHTGGTQQLDGPTKK